MDVLLAVFGFLVVTFLDVSKTSDVTEIPTAAGVIIDGNTTPIDHSPFLEGSPKAPTDEIRRSLPITITATIQTAPNFIIYEVVSGDTLYGIALENDLTIQELMHFNQLTNDALDVGDQIKIPQRFDIP